MADGGAGRAFGSGSRGAARKNSVALIGQLLEEDLVVKHDLGKYPRQRVLDARFQEKLRQHGDINVINSKIIGMNFE